MLSIFNRKQKEFVPPLAIEKKGKIGEISGGFASGFTAFVNGVKKRFWPTSVLWSGRKMSYSLCRKLYRNEAKEYSYAAFSRRIVNASVDFLDLPWSATGDDVIDEFVNGALHNYWSGVLTQAKRDSIRDGEVVVRLRRHDVENPLVDIDEWESCYLECVPPETCAIYYKDGGDYGEIEKAYIRHTVDVVDEAAVRSGSSLQQPRVSSHVLIEEITPDTFRYYDETASQWRDDLAAVNAWGFVPLVEMCNEFDSDAQSGQSDLQNSLTFLRAFHDVVSQVLVAHKAHSIPKATFNVNDLTQFMVNNWPEAFDTTPDGRPDPMKFNGEISWKGTEILFLQPEEEAGFMEVTSALGDSETLLDFLLSCIAVSSETPKSILMNQTVQDVDEMLPFAKKIERKRNFLNDPIQQLVKMLLAVNHMPPKKVQLRWLEISPDLALKKAEVLQQDVMSLEVLANREVISDLTVRRHLKPLIPEMRSNAEEAADAKKNVQLLAQAGPTSSQSTSGSDAGENA